MCGNIAPFLDAEMRPKERERKRQGLCGSARREACPLIAEKPVVGVAPEHVGVRLPRRIECIKHRAAISGRNMFVETSPQKEYGGAEILGAR